MNAQRDTYASLLVAAALALAILAVIGLTALAAGYLPARRAADLDPTEALRTN